jgi:hypothetical protein
MRFTQRRQANLRRQGLHVGHCWMCGKQFAYKSRVYLPAGRVKKPVCPVCLDRMGIVRY